MAISKKELKEAEDAFRKWGRHRDRLKKSVLEWIQEVGVPTAARAADGKPSRWTLRNWINGERDPDDQQLLEFAAKVRRFLDESAEE